MRRLFAPVGILLAAILVSCAGSKEVEVSPDEQYGHRFEGEGPEGRRTVDVTPAEGADEYFYSPAVIDTVHVRPAPFTSDQAEGGQVPVEVLVKGSLPDACTELHEVDQTRSGHIVDLRVEMRRPRRAVCATVVRPYRFYVKLDGLYGPGSYTLKVNDRPYPFAVRNPDAG